MRFFCLFWGLFVFFGVFVFCFGGLIDVKDCLLLLFSI